MNYLEPNSLKICRLVSKQWNDAAIPHFRARHPPITLSKAGQVFALQNRMKTTTRVPFETFKFQTRYTPRIEKYFQTFGFCIKNIQILSWPGKQMVNFTQLFQLLKTMPNVKKLMLVNTEFPARKEGVPALTHACLTSPPPVVIQSVETLNFTG